MARGTADPSASVRLGLGRVSLRTGMCLVVGTVTAPALAQGEPPATAPATAEAPCSRGASGALNELACELGHQVGTLGAGVLVVAAPLETDVPPTHPGRLEERLAAVVAGRLGGGAQADAETAGVAVARGRARGRATLVHLRPTIADGKLRVEADVYPIPARFWDRVRDPHPSPRAHAFAERPLDPEVRSHLPPVPLVVAETVKAKSPEQSTLALACGDTDADGSPELVVVGRKGVHLARIRRGVVEPFAGHEWSTLSSISPTPLREPIASVSVDPGRHIDVGLSDRAQAIRFDPHLAVIEKVGRRVPWPDGAGCARFVGLVVGPQLHPCVDADGAPSLETFGWGTDAIGGASLLLQDGRRHHIMAGRIADKAEVFLRDDGGRTARVAPVGAQLAVGDLEGDGQPELLAALDTLRPEDDALVVRTWRPSGNLEERLRVPVPSGVSAIAVCPQPTSGLAPIAIATGREIWIVR